MRFSSEKQSQGTSHKRQLDNILAYAELHGYKVNDSLKLQDLGLSAYTAKHLKQGALGGFLEAIKAGVIEKDGSAYLCIEQLDRLSRQDVDDAYQVFRKILKANVNIITLMDGRIYTKESLNDLMSIMYSLMLMAQANLESAKKSERILASFEKRAEKLNSGENVQYVGIFPGWIDNDGTKEKTNFIINNKAKIVQRVFEMYISGYSMNDIAKAFNNENIDQVAKRRHKNFTNSWSSGKISHLLNNRCVIGELVVKKTGEVFENYYPPIISIDDWDVVQSMRITKKAKKTAGRKSINIFTGKMFCSGCGQKYYFETDDKMTKSGKKLYYMLKCRGRKVLDCKSRSIKYDDLISSMPNIFGMITPKKDNSEAIKGIKEKISIVSLDTKKIKEKIDKLEELNDSDQLDFTIYLKESSKLQKSIKVNDARIASFKVDVARLSSDNKLEYFDKNDPASVIKARRFIDETFAGFIVSRDSSSCTALYHDGAIINFILNNSKIEKKGMVVMGDGFAGLNDFYKLQEEVKAAYNSGKMDGKFIEIIKASNTWGIMTPEKDYSLD